jgi:hypothetical protein
MKSLETQIAGQHYKNQKIQPIEYILENKLPFIEGNIVKYITRWREKGGIEDLKKVKHYVEILLEHEDGKRNKTAVPPVYAKDGVDRTL